MAQTMEEKHVLDPTVYQNSPAGKIAMAAAGDEPAHELFMLLFQLLQVAMAGKISYELGGEQIPMDVPADPLFFEKPYYPRTMKIVKRLAKKRHLKFYGENEYGVAYTLNVPSPEKRQAWCEIVTDEILGIENRPIFENVEKPFTHDEMIRVMNAAGIPVGGTFDFSLLDGTHFHLTLTPTRLLVEGSEPDKQLLVGALKFWHLQAFGNKHKLGEFSTPTPLSEMKQVAEVAEVFASSEFNTMPVDELIARMDKEYRKFWASFKTEATAASVS